MVKGEKGEMEVMEAMEDSKAQGEMGEEEEMAVPMEEMVAKGELEGKVELVQLEVMVEMAGILDFSCLHFSILLIPVEHISPSLLREVGLVVVEDMVGKE